MSARRRTCGLALVCTASALWAVITPFAYAQQPGASVRRLRGIIEKSQSWSGRIMITDNLKILGATVTVQPGCIIEFALAAPGTHPSLIVGSDDRDRGELRLLSTAERPIVFRTRPGTNAGRIIVYVRNRIVPEVAPTQPSTQPIEATSEPEKIDWHHVRFENLGYPRVVGLRSRKHSRHEPCLTFKLIGRGQAVRLADCDFDHTTRLQIDADDAAKISVKENHFVHPQERQALDISGWRIKNRPASTAIAANHLAAGIVLNSLPAVVRDNVLIGLDAAIVLRGGSFPQCVVSGNYVHNTTKKDDGRYCLNCENSQARIENNVFRGATTCVLTGSRHMSGNVFIGEANLASPYVRKSRTHQLVAALPAGSLFENNVLIGPAQAMLIPQPLQAPTGGVPTGAPTQIRNNVFDAFGKSGRAIHLNPVGRPAGKVAITNNLFLRTDCAIYDEDNTSTTVIYADHNAYAPPPRRKFDRVQIAGVERGKPGWAAADLQRDDIADLALRKELPRRAADLDFDEDLRSGRRTIAQVRRDFFSFYEPRSDSPLIHAGRKIKGTTTGHASIGAVMGKAD